MRPDPVSYSAVQEGHSLKLVPLTVSSFSTRIWTVLECWGWNVALRHNKHVFCPQATSQPSANTIRIRVFSFERGCFEIGSSMAWNSIYSEV